MAKMSAKAWLKSIKMLMIGYQAMYLVGRASLAGRRAPVIKNQTIISPHKFCLTVTIVTMVFENRDIEVSVLYTLYVIGYSWCLVSPVLIGRSSLRLLPERIR